MQQTSLDIMVATISYVMYLILEALSNFWYIVLIIGVLIFLILRIFLSKEGKHILNFVKSEAEIIKAGEDSESVFGFSKIKKKLVVFLKAKNVSPILYRTLGKIYRLWITIEGYPFVLDMNALQDVSKKSVNEEFLALYKNKVLPEIISEVVKSDFKDKIAMVILGLALGVVIGFVVTPFYLQYFKFI